MLKMIPITHLVARFRFCWIICVTERTFFWRFVHLMVTAVELASRAARCGLWRHCTCALCGQPKSYLVSDLGKWGAGPAQKYFPLEHVKPLPSDIWKAKTISDVRIALLNNSYRDCWYLCGKMKCIIDMTVTADCKRARCPWGCSKEGSLHVT